MFNLRHGRLLLPTIMVIVTLIIGSMPAFAASSVQWHIQFDTGKCLDVKGNSKDDGAIVQLYGCHNGDNQKWKLEVSGHDGPNAYGIQKSVRSGKCMDVKDGSTSQGAQIIQKSCNGSRSQLWVFVDWGNGLFQLRNLRSSMCIDYSKSRSVIQQYPCKNGEKMDNQLFRN